VNEQQQVQQQQDQQCKQQEQRVSNEEEPQPPAECASDGLPAGLTPTPGSGGGAAAATGLAAPGDQSSFFPRQHLCLGVGEAQLSRVEMFRQQSGVAVQLKQRVFDVPPLNGEREILHARCSSEGPRWAGYDLF
jgi:hypothetical protein